MRSVTGRASSNGTPRRDVLAVLTERFAFLESRSHIRDESTDRCPAGKPHAHVVGFLQVVRVAQEEAAATSDALVAGSVAPVGGE